MASHNFYGPDETEDNINYKSNHFIHNSTQRPHIACPDSALCESWQILGVRDGIYPSEVKKCHNKVRRIRGLYELNSEWVGCTVLKEKSSHIEHEVQFIDRYVYYSTCENSCVMSSVVWRNIPECFSRKPVLHTTAMDFQEVSVYSVALLKM